MEIIIIKIIILRNCKLLLKLFLCSNYQDNVHVSCFQVFRIEFFTKFNPTHNSIILLLFSIESRLASISWKIPESGGKIQISTIVWGFEHWAGNSNPPGECDRETMRQFKFSCLGVGGDWSWVGRAEFPALFVFHPELRLFIRLEWSVGSVIGPFGSLNYASFYPVLFIWQVTRSKYQVQLQQLFTNWTCRLHYRGP